MAALATTRIGLTTSLMSCPTAGLSSSSHLISAASTAAISTEQRRFRSAKFGIKGDDDHLAERGRNAKNSPNANKNNRKKEDLYEFTNLSNPGANNHTVPLGMDSEQEGDKKILKVNPLMILRKVEEDKGGKIVKAIKKIQGKPDSMRLTEDQQSDLVNAYAETKWFAVFWRPFSKINYTRARRFRFLANIGLCISICGMFTLMVTVYYQEMLNFCELSEDEQAEYRHIIMNVPIGEIKKVGDKVMKQYDPNETLASIERTRLMMGEMRKLGWHEMDWEVEGPRLFKAWYESWDFWHAFFWSSMWIGKIISGGGGYYSPKATFGRIEAQATRRREEYRNRDGFVSATDANTIQKPERVDGAVSPASGESATATTAHPPTATKSGWLNFGFGGDKKKPAEEKPTSA